MSKLFWYKRKEVIEAKMVPDEKGEFKQVSAPREVIHWDCFNLDCVVRGLWGSEKVFTVLLNDGHEQSQQQKVPSLNKDGSVKGYEIQRVRDWFYSQIELDVEDAKRFREVSEALSVNEWDDKFTEEVSEEKDLTGGLGID